MNATDLTARRIVLAGSVLAEPDSEGQRDADRPVERAVPGHAGRFSTTPVFADQPAKPVVRRQVHQRALIFSRAGAHMTAVSRKNESGMALVATLMVLMLASALMVGFFASISADQRASGIDRDQTQAYAAAHAGLEKLTDRPGHAVRRRLQPADDARSPSCSTNPPVIPGFAFVAPGGQPATRLRPTKLDAGQPAPLDTINGTIISSGAYQGLRGHGHPLRLDRRRHAREAPRRGCGARCRPSRFRCSSSVSSPIRT